MTLKSDANFEGKLTLGSKNVMWNLVNFNASSASLKICTLMQCYICQQHIKFQLKSTEELPFMTLKKDSNFLFEK